MAQLQPNEFTTYQLSDEEVIAGSKLTTAQAMLLQNSYADIALQRISLNFTPDKPLEFAQQEAFLRGQMAILSFILLRSKETP